METKTDNGAGATTSGPASDSSVLLGPITHTARGFQTISFRDRNGQECSLQQSSLADFEPPGSSAVWLGVGGSRMHLDLARVSALYAVLGTWLKEGRFDHAEAETD